MKTTNTKSTKTTSTKSKAKSTSGKKSGGCCNKKSSSQESESDPFGSYTGNPVGWGIDEPPVQDADDL